MQFSTRPSSNEKQKSWQIFDQIASSYDTANRLLSARQDVRWRKDLASHLPQNQNLIHLDLATGTADQILFLHEATDRIANSVGTDLSKEMLKIGQNKIKNRKLENTIHLHEGDATKIEYPDFHFDVVTISFGIRNVPDVEKSLREMHRVLKTNGRALILEATVPENKFIRGPYLSYFRHVLPRLGGLLSGQTWAYKYLNNTVEDFVQGEAFCQLLKNVGFKNVYRKQYFLGAATLYVGEK